MIATNDLVIKAMAAPFALSLNHDPTFRKDDNSLPASEIFRELEIAPCDPIAPRNIPSALGLRRSLASW
jgi:hypothetical protein